MGMSFASGVGLTVPLVEALWCVLLGVVQLGVGSVLFALAAQSVPAVQLTIFALGEPLLAPLWAWIGVGEVPTWATLAGGAVLFSALGLQVSARRD
jgi:drug/metabolite transporter (DMT)-like permease